MALIFCKSSAAVASLLRPATVAGLSTLAPRFCLERSSTAASGVSSLGSAAERLDIVHFTTTTRDEAFKASQWTRHISTYGPALKQADAGAVVPQMHAGSPSKSAQESSGNASDYMLMHPVYTQEYCESVSPKHKKPEKMYEYLAYYAIQTVRTIFDKATGYSHESMNLEKWMVRTIFLETVAGVPGMVAGMLRHMKSLRSMHRDNGWIHTLLEEAENERMHLLTFLQLKQPGPFFRGMVLLGQGIFFNIYMLAYILVPKTCHAAVGYLEEEAVKTYTHLIEDLDAGRIPEWKDTPAPEIAVTYWRLQEGATMRDMFLAIRADEACHSHVNHTLSELDQTTGKNPFNVGSHMVP